LKLTLGARYHDQDNGTWTEVFGPNNPRRAQMVVPGRVLPGDYFESIGKTGEVSVNFDATTYRYALAYEFTPSFMAYLGYSEGFNSGGIQRVTVLNAQGQQVQLDFGLDPEKLENYEFGMRSDWLDGRLRVNATVFHTDWLALQQRLQITNPFTGQLIPQGINQNVAEAEAEGAEITVTGRLLDAFEFDIGVGFLDTGYTQIDPGVISVQLGDKFGLAPDLQYNVGGQWEIPTGSGKVRLRADYAWTDDYIRSYNPDTQLQFNVPGVSFDQKAFGLLSARAVYVPPSEGWELAAFGTNLTNEFYLSGGFSPAILGMDFSGFGRAREFGVSLKLFLGNR
jgi:iron complex outermembrane receptor protein